VFNYDHSRGASAWLYWFIGVMAVYALLWLIPSTERFAAKTAAVLGVVGAALFWRSIVKWLRGR